MLKQLRTQTKTIMWLVAAAFVGLMVFQWGMDFTGRRNRQPDTIGSVNGETITWQEYQNALSSQRRSYTERNKGAFPEAAEKILEEQTWNTLVGQILMRQEARRLGIRVTDADIVTQIQTNPPREVMDIETFKTKGQFDPQKYQQALADPRFDWTWLEDYVREYLPQQKIQERIASSVVVSDLEAREEFARRNDKITLSYVALQPGSESSAGMTPPEDSVRAYYEAHPREFQRPPAAKLVVARLPKTVTDADAAAALQTAAEARKEIAGGVAFEDLVEDYSDATNASSQGDMGWVSRGSLDDPAAENALFAMSDSGKVSDPVRGKKGVYLFQFLGKQGDKVHAREILVPIETGHDTVAALVSRAESIRGQAKTGGLAAAASAAGISTITVGPFDKGQVPPELANYADAMGFAFKSNQGEVSPVYEGKDAVVVMQLVEKTEAGPRPLADVRSKVLEALTREARLGLAARDAEAMARAARTNGDLAAAARSKGLTVKETTSFTRLSPPPELAAEPGVVAMAFAVPVGEIGPPVKERDACYVFKVVSRDPATDEEYKKAHTDLVQQLLYRKRQEAFSAWYQELRDRAKIEDRREALLASSQEKSGGSADEGDN